MFSKLKHKAADKREEVIEEHIPKIKSLLKEKVGIKTRDILENDEVMTKALSRVYDLLIIAHPTLRFLIKRERLISFGLSNRNRLIDRHDTKSLPAIIGQQTEEIEAQNSGKETPMPRDYLQEAQDIIFGNKVALAKLLETEPDKVVGNLLFVIERSSGEMQAMIRKAASYALGQIGEPRSMKQLREYYDRERAPGVQEAMEASLTAIKLAPIPTHSQLERRQIIEDVYERRRHPDWKGEILNPGNFRITLRSQSLSSLSFEDVERMLNQRGFYDRSLNETGKGIQHQYEVAELYNNMFIIDHTTGLVWQRDGSSDDLIYDDAKKYIQGLNLQDFGGHKDWRLPTLEEAMSLMETEDKKEGLYIDPVFSQERRDVRYIWTCDLSSYGTPWYVCFPDGYCMSEEFSGVTNRVRAVRKLLVDR